MLRRQLVASMLSLASIVAGSVLILTMAAGADESPALDIDYKTPPPPPAPATPTLPVPAANNLVPTDEALNRIDVAPRVQSAVAAILGGDVNRFMTYVQRLERVEGTQTTMTGVRVNAARWLETDVAAFLREEAHQGGRIVFVARTQDGRLHVGSAFGEPNTAGERNWYYLYLVLDEDMEVPVAEIGVGPILYSPLLNYRSTFSGGGDGIIAIDPELVVEEDEWHEEFTRREREMLEREDLD